MVQECITQNGMGICAALLLSFCIALQRRQASAGISLEVKRDNKREGYMSPTKKFNLI